MNSGQSTRRHGSWERHLLALAQRQPDPSLRLVAHNVLGNTLIYLGEFRVPANT
jgi:hypothetical protein